MTSTRITSARAVSEPGAGAVEASADLMGLLGDKTNVSAGERRVSALADTVP
jgi:hypothetical protein